MAFGNGPRIVTDGLVLALDAGDKNSYPGSGTTWFDISSNRYTGSLTNGPTFSSSNGGSIVFDGTDDVAIITGNPIVTGTGDFSLCSFVKRNTTDASADYICGNYGVGNNGLELYYYLNKVYFYMAGAFAVSNITINDMNWHFVCGVRISGVAQIYFDGVFNSNAAANVNIPGVNPFTLGNGFNYTSEALNGNIANCSVYNRALSASEILQNYNAQKSRFGL
jgi:hypothetical protein